MSLFGIALLSILYFLMVFIVVDRVCKCIEVCTLIKKVITYTEDKEEEKRII